MLVVVLVLVVVVVMGVVVAVVMGAVVAVVVFHWVFSQDCKFVEHRNRSSSS